MDIVAGTMQVRNLGGGAELPDRVKSAGDISPLFAAVMAFTAATRIDQSKVKLYESAYANGAPLVFV